MGMSEFYGVSSDEESLKTLEHAEELGVTFLDTSDTYGLGHNETLLGNFLKGRRDHFVIATKFGIVRQPGNFERRIDNSPDFIRNACDASLRRLRADVIDLYYIHRIDHDHAIEDTVGAMADLVRAGKIRSIGLCEASATTLYKASAVHPVAALQSEYSLWTRFVEGEILEACRQLNIALVAYSPLGRGFLTGAVDNSANFQDGDVRRSLPRFSAENLAANLQLTETLADVASRMGATPAQVALGWLLAKGNNIIPIPGTRRKRYLRENVEAAKLQLTSDDLCVLDRLFQPGAVAGARYTAEGMKGIEGDD